MRKPIRPIRAAAAAIESIAMLAEVEIHAGAGEGDKKTPPTFAVNAYNGGLLRVSGYDLPVVIDLKGMVPAKTITANLHHDQKQIVGHVTDKTNDHKSLLLCGSVSGTGPAAQEFLGNGANGYPWQASVEALPTVRPVMVKAGNTVEVNGQTFEGPIYVARKSKLYGVAFLPRGADENTNVKIAATHKKESEMELEKWIEAHGFDVADLNDKQKAYLQAQYDAEIKAAGGKGKQDPPEISLPEFDVDDVKAAFSDHVAKLEALYAEHDDVKADKIAEIRATATKDTKALKIKALTEKWLPARCEGELIKAENLVHKSLIRAERPAGPMIRSGGNRPELNSQIIEAALCQTVGLPDIEKHYDEKTLQAAHEQFRGRIGLQQMLIMAAEANGYQRHDYRVDASNLREVLRYALPPMPMIQAAGFSTLSLPGTLSNVANKELLQGYMEEDQTWKEIAAVKPVNDFKAVTSYRMLDNMEYEELGADGEIHHGSLGEESLSRQAKTYAKMFTLTRANIINDDLGAFDDLRSRVGRGAAMKFNDVFWLAFLNNAGFFTAGRGNYITGATTTLLADGVGLQLGILAFDALKSGTADGSKRISGEAEILLHPPELQFAAGRLYQSTTVNTGGAATAEAVGNANIHAGKYRPVKCKWLSDSSISNYSGTGWYLFRNPRVMAPMTVSFLNGVQTPTVESADADFDVLGIQFRGYHDFGADRAEYLSGIKSKGAA